MRTTQHMHRRQNAFLRLAEPKARSKRTVSIPPELIPMLREHRVVQRVEMEAAGALWKDHDLVFCQPNGRPIDPRRDWDDWKALLKAAGGS